MPKFLQTLFIARSQESASLFLQLINGATKAQTLSSLLAGLGEQKDNVLNPFMGKLLLKKVLESLTLQHFDYLAKTEQSLADLFQHIVSCKRNRVNFSAFGYSEIKLQELLMIAETYESEKQKLGLLDSADVLLSAVETLVSNKYFSQFQSIVIDQFHENGINFCSSKLEEEALDSIKQFPLITQFQFQIEDTKAPKTFTPQNSYFDEGIFAIKAARKLIEQGVKDTQIAIVASNLNQYRRVIESNAPKYGMQFRFSSGITMLESVVYQEYVKNGSITKFKESFAWRVKEAFESGEIDEEELEKQKRHFVQIGNLDKEAKLLKEQAKELLGVELNAKEIVKSLVEEKHIPPAYEQSGVLVTEPNQITLQKFEHIIFIGTDLSQFPPKTKGNFLATVQQKESLLFLNNTYHLSEYYYAKLCRNAENLHLSMAENSGKKRLFMSPIIKDLPAESFEEYELIAERENLLLGNRYVLDGNGEAFVTSMNSLELSTFDGNVDAHDFDAGILSASSMTTYAKCPLRYLFTHQYKCEALALEKDEDALEATDIGTMFHSIAENFANEVQKGTITLGNEIGSAIKHKLEAIAKDEYDKYMQKHFTDEGRSITVFHKIVLNDLIKGLHNEHHQKGLLIRFLEYIYGEGSLAHFSQSEKHFMLDENFELTTDKEKALVRGFIDRIDENKADNIVSIIDYKTGKYQKNKEDRLLEEMAEYKQFQLPLYLLYAKRAFTEYEIDAFLVSFKDGDGSKAYAHLSTNTENGMLFDDSYEKNLIKTIRQVKNDIEEGVFAMTPSEINCEYCEFERICHKSVLPGKESHEQV